MEESLDNLFFVNNFISKEIKTGNIIEIIETNNAGIYELTSDNYISIIEKINDKIYININNLIDLFLIYEKQKCLYNNDNIQNIKQNIKKYVFKLYTDKNLNDITNLKNFVKEFFKLIYINLLLYDKILKYDIYSSIIKFFNNIKNNLNIFIIPEIKNKTCIICIDNNITNTLLCCNNVICTNCFNKLNYCPYCNFNFNSKVNMKIFEFKNLNSFL